MHKAKVAPGLGKYVSPNKTRRRFEIFNADSSLADVCRKKLRRHLK